MKELLISSILTALVLTIALLSVGQSRQIMPTIENPRIVIEKKNRSLKIFDGERLIKKYKIALGLAAKGDKEIEGDGKTPEGKFYVFTKNAESKFYLSLGLSYPNVEAATRGLREKIISPEEHDAIVKAIAEKRMPPQKTALGGEIYIHGGGIETDWTQGCVALRNEDMQEIFEAIPVGAEVKIEN
ncbi:MAG: L,D-transpeptidase [Pyrinomonadaceae bacterium]|nr:L,D-transpeptidase [Pyrinomonadaceae bacterium]